MVTIKSEREIELMREAGKILAKVHEELGKVVRPGISTKEIDRICEEMIRSYGCIPSFLGYEGYPASVATDDKVLHDGVHHLTDFLLIDLPVDSEEHP